jgi:hypothetical protein
MNLRETNVNVLNLHKIDLAKKILHTFAERIGERRSKRERMEEFSLTIFHTQRVNNLQYI